MRKSDLTRPAAAPCVGEVELRVFLRSFHVCEVVYQSECRQAYLVAYFDKSVIFQVCSTV
jgi:hypothetical protein